MGIDNTALLTSVHPSPGFDLVPRLTVTEGGAAVYYNVCARLTGVLGQTPVITIPQAGAIYSGAWAGPHETGFYSYDGLTWFAMSLPTVYSGGRIRCQNSVPFIQDTVWFARDRREGVGLVRAWIAGLQTQHPGVLGDLAGGVGFIVDTFSAQTTETGVAIPPQPLFGFQLGTIGRPVIALIAGVHAGEDYGTTVLRHAVTYLCGAAPAAVALRAAFRFVVLPLMNPMGREGGHCRAQFEVAGTKNDLNRHYMDIPAPFQTVSRTRPVLNSELSDGQVAAFLDFHTYANLSDPALSYFASTVYNGFAPKNAAWGAAINAKLAAVGIASASGGVEWDTASRHFTTSWAGEIKHAMVANSVECNSSYRKDDATAIAFGRAIILALHSMSQAGDFGTAPPVVIPPPVVILPPVVPPANAATIAAMQSALNAWSPGMVTQTQIDELKTLVNALVADGTAPPIAPAGGLASFLPLNTATKGNWQGVYGASGHMIPGVTTGPLTGASVGPITAAAYTWQANAADARALQLSTGGRIASCWFAPAFTLDITATGHVSFYLLDWDTVSRIMKVDAIDPATGAVVATTTAQSFNGGVYLPVILAGRALFRFTAVAGTNAVVSGIFFDPA